MPALRTAGSSYWQASRSPRYSVLFALPLFLGYEILADATGTAGGAELRNGADAILRGAFAAALGPKGPLIFICLLSVVGIWLVVRDRRKSGEALHSRVFFGMVGESALLAGLFGLVIGTLTAQLLGGLHALSFQNGAIAKTSWSTRLMLSLGAGLYEELFFRVLLVTGFAFLARVVLGAGRKMAGVLACVLSAVIFSAFHYVGPYGDKLELPSFLFRMLSGLAFSALYLTRGFGITAWTHALYDGLLLLT